MEEKDLHKILDALDDWQPVKASPYFASRVMARWENMKGASPRQSLLQLWWKPALLVAATVLNLLLIIGTLDDTSTDDQALKAFQQEYQLQEDSSNGISLYSL